VSFRRLYRYLSQDLPALRLLQARHRGVHAHIITMHQSGTHWLNNMLSWGICRAYGLPSLQHIADRSIIGRPQDAVVHPRIPRILQSHEIPSPLVHMPPLSSLLTFPRYVLLLRDMRASLVSQYEKKKHLEPFQMSFAAYLRNDRIIANGIRRDIWHRMRMLNAWDRDIGRLSAGRVLVVHYEDMKRDAAHEVQRVWEFLELPPQPAAFFGEAAASATKETMTKQEQPGAVMRVVRSSVAHHFDSYDPDDREFFTSTVTKYLHNWFGYDYNDWTVPAAAARAA
jgi:Sulfotransferase domain